MLNESLARELGPRPGRPPYRHRAGPAHRHPAARQRQPRGPGLRGAPVRGLLPPPRRRARPAGRRARAARRSPGRPAPQGVRAYAVRARRRRPGRGRPDAARVRRERGHARARGAHHPRARGHRHRSHGAPRDPAAWRRPGASGEQATCASGASSTPARWTTPALLRRLADHAIERHHPEAADAENPYLALFEAVLEAQASLVARWMLLGFVHGVLNTDNVLISGESIDFGPCAFMEAYDPATSFSSIDETGRYAYAQQPPVTEWNLARLAEALLPLIDDEQDRAVALATDSLRGFRQSYQQAYVDGMRAKLGLPEGLAPDVLAPLVEDLLALVQASHVDHTSFFRALGEGCARSQGAGSGGDDRSAGLRRVGRAVARPRPRRRADGRHQPGLRSAQPPRRGGPWTPGAPATSPRWSVCSRPCATRSSSGPGSSGTPSPHPPTSGPTRPTAAPETASPRADRPRCRLSGLGRVDQLLVEELLDAVRAELAAHARALGAPEGAGRPPSPAGC